MRIYLRIILLIVGTVITLFCNWFPVSEKNQLIFMLASFVIFGIPHGALDLYIEEGLEEGRDLRRVFFRYIIFATLYIGIWYLNPAIALLIFIFITAFHFGEIDWIGHTEGVMKKICYFLLGLCWILFLLSRHVNEALQIFESITRYNVDKKLFLNLAGIILPISLLVILCLFILFYIKNSYFFFSRQLCYFLTIQQALMIGMAYVTPLWIFFAFYFGIWHSILSLNKIRVYFNLNANFKDSFFLLKKALPFSVLAWIGILFFILLTMGRNDSSGVLSLIFIGLAVLTVPHLHVFNKLNRIDK